MEKQEYCKPGDEGNVEEEEQETKKRRNLTAGKKRRVKVGPARRPNGNRKPTMIANKKICRQNLAADSGIMPSKPQDEDRQSEDGVQFGSQSTVFSQPWWHRIKGGVMSSFGESNGVADDTDSSTAPQSGSNMNNGQDQHQVKQVVTNSPKELVGHSIVLTCYPYQDPQYAGMMNCGTPLAHPHYLGIHQSRMPLPLQMEEEPVYVNAKQYHGILRRRQSRAKAELEKKVIKTRKPYLHESRHQHAIKRARGCGGRFLNTKKLNGDVGADSSQQKESKSGQRTSLQSDSDHFSTNYAGNSSIFEDMLKRNSSTDGNNNDHRILSSTCNFNLMDREGAHYFKEDKGNQFP